jgi:hypothetical protein
MRIGTETYHALKGVLHERGLSTAVGDEGGFAPDLGSSEEAIEAILEAADRAGHLERVAIAPRSRRRPSSCTDGVYRFEGREADGAAMADFYADLADRFSGRRRSRTASRRTTGRPGARSLSGSAIGFQLVGDDLFVTNVERLQRGIDEGVGNAILVKVNQIGTLTETLDTIGLARSSGYEAVISHRSGETEDTTISDLAVATGAGQIKTGATGRTDRVAKFNQLLRIEESSGRAGRVPRLDRVLAHVATLAAMAATTSRRTEDPQATIGPAALPGAPRSELSRRADGRLARCNFSHGITPSSTGTRAEDCPGCPPRRRGASLRLRRDPPGARSSAGDRPAAEGLTRGQGTVGRSPAEGNRAGDGATSRRSPRSDLRGAAPRQRRA